jgi:hypothetical protein
LRISRITYLAKVALGSVDSEGDVACQATRLVKSRAGVQILAVQIFLGVGVGDRNFVFCGTGDFTEGLTLARQVLYHLSHTFSPFVFTLFLR